MQKELANEISDDRLILAKVHYEHSESAILKEQRDVDHPLRRVVLNLELKSVRRKLREIHKRLEVKWDAAKQ